MKLVVVAPAARQELLAAAAWYEARGKDLGLQFFEHIDAAILTIARTPASFPAWNDDKRVRKYVLAAFPYALFYREHPQRIEVVAIAHTARQPGYWRTRT